MQQTSRTSRRIPWGVKAAVAVSALVPLTTTPGSADVTHVNVTVAGPYFVGHTYEIHAEAENRNYNPVIFRDNGACIGSRPTGGHYTGADVYIDWTPTTVGTHKLTAVQDGVAETVIVEVAPSDDQPTPADTSGCDGGGTSSFGS
ncbi:hypothetical protein ACWIGI_29825 [Nocardia sp. NPDC055321]